MSERESIDCTPTWSGVMPGYIGVLQAGNPEGVRLATEALMTLAKSVDLANAQSAHETAECNGGDWRTRCIDICKGIADSDDVCIDMAVEIADNFGVETEDDNE